MKHERAARAIAVAILGSVLTGQAAAPPPIREASCLLTVDTFLLNARTARVLVVFTNVWTVPAQAVRWRFFWGDGTTSGVRDVGRFTPGTTVRHLYSIDLKRPGPVYAPFWQVVTSRLERVELADGTRWPAPGGPPAPRIRCQVRT